MTEEPELLFGIFALTEIPKTHEITLGWEWDDDHIVHFLPELVKNPYLENHSSLSPFLQASNDQVLWIIDQDQTQKTWI